MNSIVQIMRAQEGRKGNIVFRRDNGKIYFMDNHHKGEFRGVKVGDVVLVYITNDLAKAGYVAMEIDGRKLINYIPSINSKSEEYYLDMLASRGEHALFLNADKNDEGWLEYKKNNKFLFTTLEMVKIILEYSDEAHRPSYDTEPYTFALWCSYLVHLYRTELSSKLKEMAC